MKKNKMMRLASILLIAVLMSTCVISGTFAKYTTKGNAGDTARVAKWGVTVVATGNDAFATSYDNTAPGTHVVSSGEIQGETSVLAPGTNGLLAELNIDGTPEVMVNVNVTADLELTGWEVEGAVYCPIVFTVGTVNYQIGDPANNDATHKYYATVDELEAAIEGLFTALTANNVAANTPLDAKDVSVSWAWDFHDVDDEISQKDTALGNLTGTDIPKISFSFTATVSQVD